MGWSVGSVGDHAHGRLPTASYATSLLVTVIDPFSAQCWSSPVACRGRDIKSPIPLSMECSHRAHLNSKMRSLKTALCKCSTSRVYLYIAALLYSSSHAVVHSSRGAPPKIRNLKTSYLLNFRQQCAKIDNRPGEGTRASSTVSAGTLVYIVYIPRRDCTHYSSSAPTCSHAHETRAQRTASSPISR